MPEFLGLRLHHSNLCLHPYLAFSSVSLCVFSLPASSKDTCHWLSGPPGCSPLDGCTLITFQRGSPSEAGGPTFNPTHCTGHFYQKLKTDSS